VGWNLRLLTLAVVGAASIGGCGDDKPDAVGKPAAHVHHAPHGGALEVLGDEAAHVELVLDQTTGKLTGYVLDGEAEKPVRIAQEVLRLKISGLAGGDATVELKAVGSVLTGEKPGDTSQFEGESDKLKGATKFGGTLETITVRGVRFDAVPIGYPDGNEEDGSHSHK
jgi:hypothetical protein